MASANLVDDDLIRLYETVTDALGAGDSDSKALLLAQLAAELIWSKKRCRPSRLERRADSLMLRPLSARTCSTSATARVASTS